MYVVACIHRKYYCNFCEGLNIEDAGLQTGQIKRKKTKMFPLICVLLACTNSQHVQQLHFFVGLKRREANEKQLTNTSLLRSTGCLQPQSQHQPTFALQVALKIIHGSRRVLFSLLFHFHLLLSTQTKQQKLGRPGNKARVGLEMRLG